MRSKSAPPTTFLRLIPSLDGSLPPDPTYRQAQLGERLVADMVGGLIRSWQTAGNYSYRPLHVRASRSPPPLSPISTLADELFASS